MALLLKKSNAELALCLGLAAAAAILWRPAAGRQPGRGGAGAGSSPAFPRRSYARSEVRGHRPTLRLGLGGSRDAGSGQLASAVELAGAAAALVCALPSSPRAARHGGGHGMRALVFILLAALALRAGT